ncbi:MAG: AMP-binding protein [Burkholderiales bacterium]|nr:AMP-binding protein [Burkholderiales bacterium]
MNLNRAFASTVRHHGPRPALLDSARTYTWRAFGERVARLAGALGGLGVRPGTRFAVIARNGFRVEELKWAGLHLGAIPVPVNFRLAPPEIAHILADCDACHVFVESAFAALVEHPALGAWKGRASVFGESSGDAAPAYEAMLAAAQPVPASDPAPDDDALLLYTGGTTGRAKGVRLTHANILANNVAFGLAVGARPEQVYLHAAPMFHSADLLATGWFLQGAPQCYLPAFSPAAFLDAVARHRVGAVVTVPTMLVATVGSADFPAADVSSLEVLIYGAAPMALDWMVRVADAFPRAAFFNCYGLTETAPDLTIFNARELREAIDHMKATGERGGRLLSVGKPNVLNELRVVDGDGREVAPGAAGELIARGPNIMKGYHGRDAETAAALRDGWLRTGDVARIDDDGYVYLLDRLKDMVITGGENVYSSEVEAVLHTHPAVAEAAVIGLADARLGEAVTAVVVRRPGAAAGAPDLDAHCRASLGGFKVPRRFVFVDTLPKSAMGKVLKSDLRRIAQMEVSGGQSG